MTIDGLDELYGQANRLIMGRSVAAAGKALVFTSSSLDEAADAIAAIYDLTPEERSALAARGQSTSLTSVQDTAAGLLGTGTTLDARKAVSIAKTAIEGGNKLKAVAALLARGPGAAEVVAAGGQVASKGTPWGWIATAAYAAGTGSWFAYNLRSFNLAAYEARRIRERLEPHPAGPSVRELAAAGVTSVAELANEGAKAVGHGVSAAASATTTGAARGGGWLFGAALGLLGRGRGPSVGADDSGSVPSDGQPASNNKGVPEA